MATDAPNQDPVVSISTASGSYSQGEDITINVSASDPDGWIYKVDLYQNHRFITSLSRDQTSFDWKAPESGDATLYAIASDNLGARTKSAEIPVSITAADNAPSVVLTSLNTADFTV